MVLALQAAEEANRADPNKGITKMEAETVTECFGSVPSGLPARLVRFGLVGSSLSLKSRSWFSTSQLGIGEPFPN